MDTNLTWGPHILSKAALLRSLVGFLYRTRDHIPQDMKKLIYFSMIQSQLNYMIEIWGGATTSRWQLLQKIQNSALRNVFSLPYLTSRILMYENMLNNIMPVKALYEYAICNFVFKRIHGLSNGNL